MPKKRVLIVEDDRVVKNSLARLLQDSDCLVESAANGEEGLARFQQQPCDLVLTDLKLPDMDGLDMIRRMRSRQADLPFIVLTAFGEQEDARGALKMGAVDFFQKPLDASQILNITRRAFQSRRPGNGGISPESAMNQPPDSRATDPKELAEQLIRLHELLAPYSSIGRLGNGITHNLNGFLTGLMGHLELLKMKRSDLGKDLDNVLDLARKIRDNVAELSTKFDNESIREPQPLSVNQILKAELAFLRAELFFKHYIAVRLDLQESLPGIWAAYSDLSLAFEEIIMNAIDAQRSLKNAEIRIKTYLNSEFVYIEFEDAGGGFSPQALEHAFEPLWPGVTVTEDGLVRGGMGLYTARRRLEAWGGKLTLANSPGRGGLVTVALPARVKMSI